MTGLALRNPIAILMICIGVIVFAGVVTPRMPVDTFPELTPPVLIIGTLAPGLGPRDVEKTISWRLEKYVGATPGVDHVESLSRNNFSVIYVWLKWGTDLNGAQTLVQSQAGFAMAAVPKSLGVLPPFVLQYDPSNAPVIQVVVSGEGYTGPQLYDYAFNNVEPLLEGISGVASAAPDGGRMRQINVVVDPAKAQARNVTASDVAAAVARSNALLPSGEFIAPKFDANVYTNAIPKRPSSIGEAPVKVVDGRPVLIRDVAHVDDGGTPLTQSVSVNGREAVYLNVLRVPGGNTIQIVDAVKQVVEHLQGLPPGVKVQAFFDQSTFVRTTYAGLKREVLQALVLIALVILVFLQSIRGTLIVSVAIPLSFAITLIVLYACGQTLNAFTLGGLTLAMGRLVDDAVVVLESIHRHQRMGRCRPGGRARGDERRGAPGPRLHAHDDGGAAPGAPPRGAREEALRAARAHGRRRDDRLLLRQHGRHARRLSLLPRARRARAGGEGGRGGDRSDRGGVLARPPPDAPVPVVDHRSVGRPRRRERVGGGAAPELVLPRDRRVDGPDLRPLRAGGLDRGRGGQAERDGQDALARAPARGREDGHRERRNAAERARAPREPERRAQHGVPADRVHGPRGAEALAGRAGQRGARDPQTRVPGRGDPRGSRRPRRERLLQRVPGADRRRGPGRQPR